jgi:hypothetical protein
MWSVAKLNFKMFFSNILIFIIPIFVIFALITSIYYLSRLGSAGYGFYKKGKVISYASGGYAEFKQPVDIKTFRVLNKRIVSDGLWMVSLFLARDKNHVYILSTQGDDCCRVYTYPSDFNINNFNSFDPFSAR